MKKIINYKPTILIILATTAIVFFWLGVFRNNEVFFMVSLLCLVLVMLGSLEEAERELSKARKEHCCNKSDTSEELNHDLKTGPSDDDFYSQFSADIYAQSKNFYGFWGSLILVFKGHRFEKCISSQTLKKMLKSFYGGK